MARFLVTGAGGFIGSALCRVLAERGHDVIAGLRRPWATPPHPSCEPRLLGEIAPDRGWSGQLHDIDVIVHLAQRAHRRAAPAILAGEPAAAAGLARAAARQGGRRFVYLSSIKAMGEATEPGQPFRSGDPERPQDAYGRAKLATERALAAAAAETGIELVVVRPPLVYGPGVAGNFRALVRLAASGLPLPFAAVDNRRSLLFVGNLADLVATAALHPEAAGRVWLASDGVDHSTPALISLLAQAQGRAARLFALPAGMMAALGRVPGVGPSLGRLTLSLQIDDSSTREALSWQPPFWAESALAETARALRR